MHADTVALWTPRALAVLRIVTAYLFLQHGTAKWQVDVKWLTGEVKVSKPESLL